MAERARFGLSGLAAATMVVPLGLAGLITYGFHELWCALLNGRGHRRLTPALHGIMAALIPDVDLGRVRLRDHARLALPKRFRAFTLGHRIYVRGPFDAADVSDLGLLLHELVHVRQYERAWGGGIGFAMAYGAGVSRGWAWAHHPMEVEAIDYERKQGRKLATLVEDEAHGRARGIVVDGAEEAV